MAKNIQKRNQTQQHLLLQRIFELWGIHKWNCRTHWQLCMWESKYGSCGEIL